MEERPGIEKTLPLNQLKKDGTISNDQFISGPDDLDSSHVIVSDNVRRSKKLPVWRQHSQMECLVLKDQLFNPITPDAITIFGMRPPELRCIASHDTSLSSRHT
jgi:hypothetical protein